MPVITAFYLYDVKAKKDIRQINSHETVYLNELPAFTIRAAVSSDTSSVKFVVNDKVQMENYAPYNCLGDTTPLGVGDYSIAAQPWSAKNATGTYGTMSPLIFTIVASRPQTTTLLKGVNYFNEFPLAQFKTYADDCGIKGIRTWLTMHPGEMLSSSHFDWMRWYKKAGYKVTAVATIPEKGTHASLPTAQQTKDWFNHTVGVAAGAIDAWELGNEPNLANYWNGTLTEFMNNYMKPAYGVLKAKNQKVLGASVAEDTAKLKALVDLGYLEYCDEPTMHIYTTNAQKHIDGCKKAFEYVKGKKLIITEWNIHGYWNTPRLTDQQWADSLPVMLEGIRPYCSELYYFQTVKNTAPAGVAGLFTKGTNSFTHHEPFYSAFKNLRF